ncbi:MAG: urea ABC transporter permease subunit UrtC [Fibrobacterota bacterium]|nr:MAG: urea ABC transporter permease subunit UrtC [Fibrobacterota bacterium]
MREGPLLKSLGRSGQIALALFVLTSMVMVPLLRLLPETSAFHPSDFVVTWLGKILCYMVLALALDLVWGLTGILSLGHGVFFAIGGYCFGMYLMRSIGHDGVYKSDLPDFMVFLDWKEYPWFWTGTQHFWWAIFLVIMVPAVLAFVVGFFAFRSRIKGVYFSIITQALTYATMLLFFRNETGFGGNNGFTDFKRILGMDVTSGGMRTTLFVLSAALLATTLLGSLWLARSRFGRILTAIRDAESRLQFCGYDTLWYKLTIWTLSAVIAGVAGALYVPQVGIINPSEMSPANSIEVAIWVAVGGRGTLVGPLVGAAMVNMGKSWLTANFPNLWLYALGGLFIFVTLFLPNGVMGLVSGLLRRMGKSGASS